MKPLVGALLLGLSACAQTGASPGLSDAARQLATAGDLAAAASTRLSDGVSVLEAGQKQQTELLSDREPPAPNRDAASSIRCTSEPRCVVASEFVHAFLRDPTDWSGSVRFVATQASGTSGIKIFGVHDGSLLGLLGFHNGDLLIAINGEAVRSIQGAQALLPKLRRASSLQLDYLRESERISLDIVIDYTAPPADAPHPFTGPGPAPRTPAPTAAPGHGEGAPAPPAPSPTGPLASAAPTPLTSAPPGRH